jgi:succinyl-CoA synthetase beta subunit
MKLFEYQAKELFRKYGIPVPRSILVRGPGEVRGAYRRLNHPVIIKAQVLSGGRGKAGGIVKVSSEGEAVDAANRIMKLDIGGEIPSALLVEEAFSHDGEMYLSITLDRGERCFVVIASKAGGMDVEALAGKVVKKIPTSGLGSTEASGIARKLGIKRDERKAFVEILLDLERLSREEECELAEINPLAINGRGRLLPLDAKVILDDNALFRHPEFSKLHPADEFEDKASREGFAFVRLEGNVAVVGNGAGLVLSTLDLVADAGGEPACFLDLGGGAQKDRVQAAVELVNRLPNADRILVNIFGGITRTTDVAEGLRSVLEKREVKPIFARISGAEEREAKRILEGTRVELFPTAQQAVNAAVNSA